MEPLKTVLHLPDDKRLLNGLSSIHLKLTLIHSLHYSVNELLKINYFYFSASTFQRLPKPLLWFRRSFKIWPLYHQSHLLSHTSTHSMSYWPPSQYCEVLYSFRTEGLKLFGNNKLWSLPHEPSKRDMKTSLATIWGWLGVFSCFSFMRTLGSSVRECFRCSRDI